MSRILVCDDEEGMRSFVARALKLDGHRTAEAEHGAQALEIMARAKEKFDLVVADIRMPVMDGIALALNVARDFPSTSIVLMTGFADQRERAADLKAIIHDVATKPFSLADIRRLVQDTLTARST
jgi:CheY-like chemotaxis protein